MVRRPGDGVIDRNPILCRGHVARNYRRASPALMVQEGEGNSLAIIPVAHVAVEERKKTSSREPDEPQGHDGNLKHDRLRLSANPAQREIQGPVSFSKCRSKLQTKIATAAKMIGKAMNHTMIQPRTLKQSRQAVHPRLTALPGWCRTLGKVRCEDDSGFAYRRNKTRSLS